MSQQSNLSKAECFSLLSAEDRQQIYKDIPEPKWQELLHDWRWWARPNQLPPPGNWRYWLMLAGRGGGKTRAGAETVRQAVKDGYRIIHMVAPTAADARDVMIQGEGGLLSCYPPGDRPLYEPSKRMVTWADGSVAHLFSAQEPERLRGPQWFFAWCAEAAAWKYAEETWDNLMFGLRLGDDPRAVVTTTPKPVKLIRDLMKNPHTVVTRWSSYENRAWLAPVFFDSIIRKYEGTRLGRQELMAELLEDIPGALWTRAAVDALRVDLSKVPALLRVVVAIDPAVTANEGSDETGIVVVGLAETGHCYVLEDASLRASPGEWARMACRMLLKWNADRIVAEVNNGGDLVEGNLRSIQAGIPYRAVRASRGKMVRAEPVAALYEQFRCHHVKTGNPDQDGAMEKLEDQMCGWTPGTNEGSPDRMDALVWAITDLVIQPEENYIMVQDYSQQISPF